MKLTFGIVALHNDIINYIDPAIDNSWTTWSDGDYIVHFLYDVECDTMVMHEDNCHGTPYRFVEAYVAGLRRMWADVEIDYKLVVVNDDQDPYHSGQVIEALKAGNWYRLTRIGGF